MTISCSLGPQLRDEALSIDVKLLLNTEVLKSVRTPPTLGNDDCVFIAIATVTMLSPSGNPQDSSSVIQFVTRGSMQVNDKAVESKKGLPEDYSVSSSPRTMGFFLPGFMSLSIKQQNERFYATSDAAAATEEELY